MIYENRSKLSIYFVCIEAVPRKDNQESKMSGGAYIDCWVKAETREMAVAAAKEYITNEKWE